MDRRKNTIIFVFFSFSVFFRLIGPYDFTLHKFNINRPIAEMNRIEWIFSIFLNSVAPSVAFVQEITS